MVLPLILSPPPSQYGWQEWIFAHARDHQEIVNAVLAQKNTSLPLYDLDDLNTNASDTWLERHQQAHTDMNDLLGVAGSDLQSVDFSKPNEVQAWFWLNYQEHLGIRTILKI